MSIYKPRDYLNLALILIHHLALKCAFGESYNELYSRYNYSPPSYMMSVFHQLQVDAIYQYLPSIDMHNIFSLSWELSTPSVWDRYDMCNIYKIYTILFHFIYWFSFSFYCLSYIVRVPYSFEEYDVRNYQMNNIKNKLCVN